MEQLRKIKKRLSPQEAREERTRGEDRQAPTTDGDLRWWVQPMARYTYTTNGIGAAQKFTMHASLPFLLS